MDDLDALVDLEGCISGGAMDRALLPVAAAAADVYQQSPLLATCHKYLGLRTRDRAGRFLRSYARFIYALSAVAAVASLFATLGDDSSDGGDRGAVCLVALCTFGLCCTDYMLHVWLAELVDGRGLQALLDEVPPGARASAQRICQRGAQVGLATVAGVLVLWASAMVYYLQSWLSLANIDVGGAESGAVAVVIVIGTSSSVLGTGIFCAALQWLWLSTATLRLSMDDFSTRLARKTVPTPKAALEEYLRLAAHARNQARSQQHLVAALCASSVGVSLATTMVLVLVSQVTELAELGIQLYLPFALVSIVVVVSISHFNDHFDGVLRALAVYQVFEPAERSWLRDDLAGARAKFEIYGFAPDNSLVAAGLLGAATTLFSAGLQSWTG